MNETKTPRFEVLIINHTQEVIERIERLLDQVIGPRKEKITVHKALTIKGGIELLAKAEKSLIPLAVMSGMYEKWYEVPGRIKQMGFETIVAFMVGDNDRTMLESGREGIMGISLQQPDGDVIEEIKNLLFDPNYAYGMYLLADAAIHSDDGIEPLPIQAEDESQEPFLEEPVFAESDIESQEPAKQSWDY